MITNKIIKMIKLLFASTIYIVLYSKREELMGQIFTHSQLFLTDVCFLLIVMNCKQIKIQLILPKID